MTDRSNAETTMDAPTSPDEQSYDVPTGVEPGIGIVEAVADATGEGPMDLPPLQATIDVDAMNALLDGDGGVGLRLRYADCIVDVDGSGSITVSP